MSATPGRAATLDAALDLPRRAAGLRPLRVHSDRAGVRFGRPSFLLVPWVPESSLGPLLDSFAGDHPAVAWADRPDAADVAVLPFDAACLIRQPYGPADPAAVGYAQKFVAAARRDGLPAVAVAAGDSAEPLGVPFDVVLRHAIDRARPRAGEYCLPGWFDAAQSAAPDFEVLPSPRGRRPRVGFCGQAAPSGVKLLVRYARDARRRVRGGSGWGADGVDGLLLRRRTLRAVAGAGEVDAVFVTRDRYFASLADHKAARDEYLANLRASDYILCVRGGGNYSFRFYDALANGRVPVLIDTDCGLPFDDLIDYAGLFPVVPLGRLRTVGAVIADHYARYDDAGWRHLQGRLRQFYRDLLSPAGYFRNLGLVPELGAILRGPGAGPVPGDRPGRPEGTPVENTP